MIAILAIGNELLSGQVRDTNVAHMLTQLGRHGFHVGEVRIVSDDVAVISQALVDLSRSHQWVVTTGGVGPTHDDVTMKAYSKAFGSPLTRHQALVDRLTGFYGQRLKPGHLRMALLPQAAELVDTASSRWPLIRVGNCFALPGLPEVFLLKFEALLTVLPPQSTRYFARIEVRENESEFAIELEEIQHQCVGVEIGSYPQGIGEDSTTQITCKGTDQALLNTCFTKLTTLFEARGSMIQASPPDPFDPGAP